MADETTLSKLSVEEAVAALIGDDEATEAFAEVEEETTLDPKAEEAKQRERVNAVAFEITTEFRARKSRRTNKENQWFNAEAGYLGAVTTTTEGQTQGETPFGKPVSNRRSPTHNAIQTKVDTIISVHWSMQFAAGEKNWDFLPPESPKDMQGNPPASYRSPASRQVRGYRRRPARALPVWHSGSQGYARPRGPRYWGPKGPYQLRRIVHPLHL